MYKYAPHNLPKMIPEKVLKYDKTRCIKYTWWWLRGVGLEMKTQGTESKQKEQLLMKCKTLASMVWSFSSTWKLILAKSNNLTA